MHISILDFLYVLVILHFAIKGYRYGFLDQFFSFLGFCAGILTAIYSSVFLQQLVLDFEYRDAALFGFVFVSGILGALLVQGVFHYFSKKSVPKISFFHLLNSFAGAIFGTMFALVSIWTFSLLLIILPQVKIPTELGTSKLHELLIQKIPNTSVVISELQKIADDNNFPHLFIGNEPQPAPKVEIPLPADIAPVVERSRSSVAKIESTGCRGISYGSGFSVSPHLIITNAHVVAGSDSTAIRIGNDLIPVKVILFNPNLDVAILSTKTRLSSYLSLSTGLAPRGTRAVVVGYPEGGPFTAVAAGVSQRISATGRNIYNEGVVNRDVYELQTTIKQGNSGGPLIALEGSVIGIVFGKSLSKDGVGYALTSLEVQKFISTVTENSSPVSTENCLSE